jgi:predicted ATPase
VQPVSKLDISQMLRDLDGDKARLTSMAAMVGGEVPHHIRTMRENLAAGRLDGLEFSARYLGMLFDSLLAESAAEAARDLESAARRRQQAESQFAFEFLEDEIEGLLADLAEIRTNPS